MNIERLIDTEYLNYLMRPSLGSCKGPDTSSSCKSRKEKARLLTMKRQKELAMQRGKGK